MAQREMPKAGLVDRREIEVVRIERVARRVEVGVRLHFSSRKLLLCSCFPIFAEHSG